MKEKTMLNYDRMPIWKAVIRNVGPAVIAMIMVLIYNLADTFFIGQTNDPILVAAVSLATPAFLLFMAVGTIFGIGGTSVISRSLGEGNVEYAKKVNSFCFYSCIVVGILMSLIFIIGMNPILDLIGATPATYLYTKNYLMIACLGGPMILLNNCYSNILRAEGESMKAMFGSLLGNVINVVLDPLMILTLNWGIEGAAVATVLGNVVGALYYIVYFLKGKSILGISIRQFTCKEKVAIHVLSIGIPASLGSILMSVSSILLNTYLAPYGDLSIAAIGVAMKITMITGMVCIGIGQGVQPLLGYFIGQRNWTRYKKVMDFSLIFAGVIGSLLAVCCYFGLDGIVSAFLQDQEAHILAMKFSEILLSTSFLFGVYYVLVNAIQAMGQGTFAFILNICRQGVIYIAALMVLGSIFRQYGYIWAQPVADVLSLLLALMIYPISLKRTREKYSGKSENEQKLIESII